MLGMTDFENGMGGYSPRNLKAPVSIRSSFDYIDVNMNEAMRIAGAPSITGRGKRFLKKSYLEDAN